MLAEDISIVDKYNLAYIAIIGSVLAAIVSLITLFVNQIANRQNQAELQRHQRELEELKATIQEQKSEKDARRDYEYDARKRLYEQCEPLLFQLTESAENALYRIYSLARTARNGDLSLEPNQGWLIYPTRYYFKSTVYLLLAPLVSYRLINQRLTLVDLTLSPHTHTLYELVKRLFILFTDDFPLAKIEPEITYEPNNKDWSSEERKTPEKNIRQGMNLGNLSIIIEKMIVTENGNKRCINFGEFNSVYFKDEKEVSEEFIVFATLLQNFHPKTRPVLWRILVAQAYLYQRLIQTRDLKISKSTEDINKVLPPLISKMKEELEWRNSKVASSDVEVFEDPFNAAEEFLRDFFDKLPENNQ